LRFATARWPIETATSVLSIPHLVSRIAIRRRPRARIPVSNTAITIQDAKTGVFNGLARACAGSQDVPHGLAGVLETSGRITDGNRGAPVAAPGGGDAKPRVFDHHGPVPARRSGVFGRADGNGYRRARAALWKSRIVADCILVRAAGPQRVVLPGKRPPSGRALTSTPTS
jgi:hypothetical protein